MDRAVTEYIEAIPTEHRPLFDRICRLIGEACPAAEISISYKMPTFKVGKRRLHVATWKHGVSIYSSKPRDGGFTNRHPQLRTSTGTIHLRSDEAGSIADGDISDLARAALAA
jgi:uncharacterized protein YdhG (YjbR/CyaY superfamily)